MSALTRCARTRILASHSRGRRAGTALFRSHKASDSREFGAAITNTSESDALRAASDMSST